MAQQYSNFSNPTITSDQPMGWQAAQQQTGNAINSIGSYLADQQSKVQGMQQDLGKQLLQYKVDSMLRPGYYAQMGYGQDASAKLDAMISGNPYARQALQGMQQSLGQAGQSQQQQQPQGQVNSQGGTGGGYNMSTQGGNYTPSGQPITPFGVGGNASMSGVNPMNGNVNTGTTMTAKGPMGDISNTNVNLGGVGAEAQVKAQGEANVAPSKAYNTKMAETQALGTENIARDNTQMTSVFATLKNLHDIHSQLASQNLAGTHLGELGQKAMPYVGDIAALTGQKPADLQNRVMSPDNQNLIGQFQSGRNEGITRAIQPLQNQVDKTGSSRISESLMDMTKGEYGDLTDPQAEFDGKTLGTAKTLYRITLASQNYADQLKAQGIKLNSNDPNFNPDTIAQHIYQQAQGIQFTPAQAKDFNGYANQIMGSKNVDYSGVLPKQGSMNPVTAPQGTSGSWTASGKQGGRPLTTQIAQQLLQAAGGDKNKARQLATNQGYSF